MPLVRQWRLFEREGLDDEGERARRGAAAAVTVLDKQATRFVEQREESAARRAARGGKLHTVETKKRLGLAAAR